MYGQTTSRDSCSATSSPASASGAMPCAALGGLTIVQFGQALAPANLSATQAAALGLLMSGISGRTSSNSSRSVALQMCLESRLRARTASRGSTLFNLTWKARSTPSGRQICALRASARRTSDSACSLPHAPWPTPDARDFKCGPQETYAERSGTTKGDSLSNLVTAVCGGWRSPNTVDSQLGTRKGEGQVQLCHQAVLAGWPTTTVMDAVGAARHGYMDDGRERAATNPRREVLTGHAGTTLLDAARMAGPARLTVTGQLLTGSSAETASGGQLNPGHSRWLMGLPSEWDACGVTAMQSLRTSPKSSSRRTSTRKG